jgi:hypothetical protein
MSVSLLPSVLQFLKSLSLSSQSTLTTYRMKLSGLTIENPVLNLINAIQLRIKPTQMLLFPPNSSNVSEDIHAFSGSSGKV